MIYLDRQQIIDLHAALIRASGGSPGLRELGLLDSAVAQPRMAFGVATAEPYGATRWRFD